MSDETAEEAEEEPKSSKLPLILGLVTALVGGGGGFFATYSGMLFAPESNETDTKAEEPIMAPLPDVAFVPIEPLTISMGSGRDMRHLKFRAQLEVPTEYQMDVEKLLPRVTDVLNGYLRAIELQDIEETSALIKLRAQMLRRVQIVTGAGRVNDLLIMEFVLT